MLALLLAVSLLDAGVVAAATADLASTEYGLSKPGLREANPLLQTPGSRAAVKLASTAVVLVVSRHLDTHGHKRGAKIMRWVAIIGWGGAAAWNMRQASKR